MISNSLSGKPGAVHAATPLTLTPHHAKYFAHDLTRRAPSGMDRLSMTLFDAAVDLNPHQIEASLFALQSPLSKGVILADEVGLGKTIEAGIVLCQYWAERKRRLLVICPASIRKQWALELQDKFNLPVQVFDAKVYREVRRSGRPPLGTHAVVVLSHHYANRLREELKTIAWDLVVIDEAHKLRNAYRPSNKVGQGIRWATEDCRKLLLTATPLQNSLLELYGLSTLIDEHLFGDVNSFRSQYASAGSTLDALRQRLSVFCKRTLRNEVMEYIRYTERRTITQPFKPTDKEHALYEAVSGFLQRENSYALPQRQRHLTALILRKVLASSSQAIAATLDTLRVRLETLRDAQASSDPEFTEQLIEAEDIEDDLLDEILAESKDADPPEALPVTIDRQKLREEIGILQRLATWARAIGIDTKTRALLMALEVGFEQMATTGATRKALIFTESCRTQGYLKAFLESQGYQGQVVLFNGTNGGPEATAIYARWAEENRDTGRASGSRAVDVRTALIECFQDKATILLATEAAAEGINLQFCSLVVNYDLPWNPQRIEQRIGRCHRYGQEHDVVVINFLNERNAADRRVLELLTEKFSLFSGVFGASDEVLGSIESGVDFEKRILGIYQACRTPEEIDAAFHTLQAEMDEQIRTRLDETRRALFEHFDEDVHQRLRLGQCRRHTITPADVRAALADLRRTHAASTCNHYRQALLSLYQYLDGTDAPNPVRAVPNFASPDPEPRGLTYEMVQGILAAMSDQGTPTGTHQPRAAGSKAKARCRVIAFTGMRPSEIMRYRPEHWDHAAHRLTVLTSKGGKTRTIPLTADGEAALQALENLGAVGRFSTSTVHRAFRLALVKLGITGIRPYDLRHSYGTAMYQVTGDTRIVKELLGHSTTAITERYTLGHVPEYMQVATDRFQALTRATAPSVVQARGQELSRDS